MGTMFLGGIKPGRVLDIGCGNGSFLALMRSAGWDIAGVESDPQAAKLASERLNISVCEEQFGKGIFAAASFHAITLHHMIEHVHDPIGVIAECRRLLKPEGLLIIVTPNLSSVGHAFFGADWRGLEPPRHLHVFTPRALAACAELAGISVKSLQTSARMAPSIWLESRGISSRRNRPAGRGDSLGSAIAFLMLERAVKILRPNAGEELVLVGTPL